jgi:hypothetical protein
MDRKTMTQLETIIEKTLEKYKDAQINLYSKEARTSIAKEIAKQITNNL